MELAGVDLMKANLAFGKSALTFDLPDRFRYFTLDARSANPLADPQNELRRVLESPIASPALKDIAMG